MLAFFPEYVKTYEVFKMEPRVGGGFGKRYGARKVGGYWSWRKQSKMDEEGDLRALNYQATFWVKSFYLGKRVLVGQNDYVEVGGKIFIVIDDQDFSEEGGFSKCLMQELEGPTDRQVTNRRVDGAIAADY